MILSPTDFLIERMLRCSDVAAEPSVFATGITPWRQLDVSCPDPEGAYLRQLYASLLGEGESDKPAVLGFVGPTDSEVAHEMVRQVSTA